MYTLTVLRGNQKYTLDFEGAPTVQEVLAQNGIIVSHPCGGKGLCGKCSIEISGNISVPDERELAIGRRLSCRTRLYGDATATLCEDNGLYAEETAQGICVGDSHGALIGAAVDIGTTTIVLSVYDLKTGELLSVNSMLNSQSAVAADVIGRIDAACSGKLMQLKEMVVSCIAALSEKSGYKDSIDKWCITGNTAMLYLFEGRDPISLSAAPFRAEHLFGEQTSLFGRTAYLPECMGAFVGADITCAILDSGMCDREETAILCDIGTNGEIALWKNGKIYAASTAAGPVFEGSGISCGCRSVPGAIERVTLTDNTLEPHTIGGALAVGLCGSGVIDAISCLLDNGTVDETGAMKSDKVTVCGNIVLTKKDVQAIQLAKAAISAGIRTLLQITDTHEDEISCFYIAGGFGSHLNINSAIRIGLLPDVLRNRVKILGNAALKGAATMLTDEKSKKKSHDIACNAECINLGGMPEFNDNYIDGMFFPKETVSCLMLRLAENVGFSHYGIFKTDILSFRKDVRDMCASGRCGSYGKRWTCPPYCGTLEESAERASRFDTGIVLQMTGIMDDDFDVKCIKQTEQAVKNKLADFVKCLSGKNIPCLPMSAGTCTKCANCTCPDLPCRFPDEAFISMEAYGLMVSDVCSAADVRYNYGQGTITFTVCVLFNDK